MNSCVLECDYDVDADLEDFSCDTEQTDPTQHLQSFFKEIEPIIKQCIKNYFFDKNLHNGKKIENSLLELSYYSSLLFNTSLSDAVIKAYALIEEYDFLSSTQDQNVVGEDIMYMLELLRDIQKITPQEFVGGMILMHLELIEGIEIW